MVKSIIFVVAFFIVGFFSGDCFSGTIQLPQTGQIRCFDATGGEVSCAGTGQDGDIRAGVPWPVPRFTKVFCSSSGPCPAGDTDCDGDPGNDVVIDNMTGLMWPRNGNIGGGTSDSWREAVDYAYGLNLCGFSDWRLPNINELWSLVNGDAPDTAAWLNLNGFYGVQSFTYWSSTTSAVYASGTYDWYVDLAKGRIDMKGVGDPAYGWAVRTATEGAITLPRTGQVLMYRSGDDGDLEMGVVWPTTRFADHGDGTVTDNLTGLMWTKDTNPFGAGGKTLGWIAAFSYIASLNSVSYLGYTDWRLPNTNEILSLLDRSKAVPGLPAGHPFTNIQFRHWTSTSVANSPWQRWALTIENGVMTAEGTDGVEWYAWPVRGGVIGTPYRLSITKSGAGTGKVTSSPHGIDCGATCENSFSEKTQVTLSASPDTGSLFAGWSGGNCSGTGTCMVTMTSEMTITATFDVASYTVTPQAGAGGSLSPSTPQTVAYNGKVSFTVTPAVGYTISSVSGCNGALVDNTYTTGFIAANCTVTATFAVQQFTLTATKDGIGGGIVSAPGLSCAGDTCTGKYDYNAVVNVLATPNPDSTVVWYGCDSVSGNTCTVTMNAPKTIYATFNVSFRTLVVNKSGSGRGTVTSLPPGINCGTDCMESYSKTTSVTLTASPEPGSEFAYWDGGCSGLSPTCALTVSTDTSVQAVFMSTKTKKFNLSVVRTKTNRGDGTVVSTDGRIDCGKDCKESYYPGTPVVLTATPLPGSVFTGWSGHCTGTGTCSVTMDKATMVRAAFEGPYMLTVSKVSRKKGGGIVTSSPPGIDCGYDCKESFTKGTSVNLTATPNPGSTFTGWAGFASPCKGTGTCTVTMEKNVGIQAIFTGTGLSSQVDEDTSEQDQM